MSFSFIKAGFFLSSRYMNELPQLTSRTPVLCRLCQKRFSSVKKKGPLVALSEDGSTVLSWHPEPAFPYEHTKPLPRKVEEIREDRENRILQVFRIWNIGVPFITPPNPFPKIKAKIDQHYKLGDSVLKVQHLMEEKLKYRPDGPDVAELANIFHTTKHQWYPRPSRKYIKPNPPKDRDGL